MTSPPGWRGREVCMQLITGVWCHPGLWARCWLGWVEAEGWQKLPLGGWSERSRPPGRKDGQ